MKSIKQLLEELSREAFLVYDDDSLKMAVRILDRMNFLFNIDDVMMINVAHIHLALSHESFTDYERKHRMVFDGVARLMHILLDDSNL